LAGAASTGAAAVGWGGVDGRAPDGGVLACGVRAAGVAFPFTSYREGQREALEAAREAFTSGARVVVIEAPTGSGKSALAVALALEARSAYVLTGQKVLQDQYHRDYLGLSMLKGRANYPCDLVEHATAACAPCLTGRVFAACAGCSYYHARDEALAAPIALMNYAVFLHQLNDAGGFDGRELLVLDEAHGAETHLMQYVQPHLSDALLERAGIDERLPAFLDPEFAIDVAEAMLPRLLSRRAELEAALAEERTHALAAAASLQALQWLDSQARRLRWLCDTFDAGVDWVCEHGFDAGSAYVSWKPVDVAALADELLLGHAQRVLMLTATVLDERTFLGGLGIDPQEAAVIRVASTFPPERRPLVLRPVARLTRHHQARELPLLVREVAAIMDDHDAEKGVIHTHSYRIATALRSDLPDRHRRRLVTHLSAEGRQMALEEHLMRPEPTVLLTPSMTEGLDLADDLARWQVICKLPYPYLGDPQVAARRERDPRWYAWRTSQALVQAYGRVVRSRDDHAVTYLLDADAPAFVERERQRLPAWFLEALRPG
jgi:ATP-dependent DNA helicase DinG